MADYLVVIRGTHLRAQIYFELLLNVEDFKVTGLAISRYHQGTFQVLGCIFRYQPGIFLSTECLILAAWSRQGLKYNIAVSELVSRRSSCVKDIFS